MNTTDSGIKDAVKAVHEAALEDALHRHNLTVKGVAEDVGVLTTNSANGNYDIYLEAKKRENDALFHKILLEAIERQLDSLGDNIDRMLKEAKQHLNRAKAARAILEGSFDPAEAAAFYTQETGIDTTDWSNIQIYEGVQEIYDSSMTSAGNISKQITTATQVYGEVAGQEGVADKYKQRAESFKQKTEDFGQNFSEEMRNSRRVLKSQNNQAALNVMEEGVKAIDRDEMIRAQSSYIPSTSMNNNPFSGSVADDPFAGNATTDPFASRELVDDPFASNEKEKISVAATAIDDPFAAEAGNITDPFNEKALGETLVVTNALDDEFKVEEIKVKGQEFVV